MQSIDKKGWIEIKMVKLQVQALNFEGCIAIDPKTKKKKSNSLINSQFCVYLIFFKILKFIQHKIHLQDLDTKIETLQIYQTFLISN